MLIHELLSEAEASAIDAKIRKDCAFYYEQVTDPSLRLYRGSNSKNMKSGSFREFRPRVDPVDTPIPAHKYVNKLFVQNFKHPFRNGLFVSGSKKQAEEYGTAYVIIPKGKFEWLMSQEYYDMFDLFNDLDTDAMLGHTDGDDDDDDEYMNRMIRPDRHNDKILEIIQAGRWAYNKALDKCIRRKHEIMLWCPGGYYMFKEEDIPEGL